jgi:cyclophilin family peptidyl-prolyl cis-trans isomerase
MQSQGMQGDKLADEKESQLDAARKNFDGKMLTGKHTVVLKTTKGSITLELDADAAPRTVTNFILLAKAGYFNGLTFHRVIDGFMIQGGDPLGNGTGGEGLFGASFEDEINANSYGLDKKKIREVASDAPPELLDKTIKEFYESQGYKYKTNLKSLPFVKGAIAMANRGPDTNGSQFFIMQANEAPFLEGKHTVFGKTTAGLDVIDAIAKTPRDASDMPTTPVTFTVEVK